MLWSRKPAVPDKARAAGVDLTSSRARAVAVSAGEARPIPLDGADELPLVVALDRRTPEVGRAGFALCRKAPHAVCSNFLPFLAHAREWRHGRHVIDAEAAVGLVFAKLRGPVTAESAAVALTLPAYLTPVQVGNVVAAANRAKLPLKGTAVGALALTADRAAAVLTGNPAAPEVPTPDWVVPLRPAGGGPGAVLVVDADEHALSAAVVEVDRDRVRAGPVGAWPRFAVKAWKDRLLDAVSDRCVRLCRRDPRDSADAEQALFEQLDDALDRTRSGQRVSLTVRTDRWFQDVVQLPDDFDAHCAALARGAAEAVRDLPAQPPRAVWLTHAAGRLPGLARAVHTHAPLGTAVEVLPTDAVARAAAALVPRWLAAELPRAHLDAVIPLEQTPAAGYRGSDDRPARGQK
ncbi:MAG: hypothetical protein C0501_29830 [Isosphaera sp.]|nr:hypothetical protein [Isosphaera sp.]